MSSDTNNRKAKIRSNLFRNIWRNYILELKTILADKGLIIMMGLGPLLYPLLYGSLYKNETVTDIPIGIVDNSGTQFSHKLIRSLDATQNLKVANYYSSMKEAQDDFEKRKINGIVFIPKNLNSLLLTGQQATISVYSDVSSFMYYKAIYQSCNYCIVSFNKGIQMTRLNAIGTAELHSKSFADPMPFQNVTMFNSTGGFSSFIVPAILVLIIFQTLFLSITMMAGTSKEENRLIQFIQSQSFRGSIFSLVVGKALVYFLIYSVWIAYALFFIPRLFELPHIGDIYSLLILLIPFLLATIFFSMTISVLMRHRESSLMLFMFMSLVLLFLSGLTWPQSNISPFWKNFAWLFPSTHGIQGFLKVNTMGAQLYQIKYELISLWAQVCLYLCLAVWFYRRKIKFAIKSSETHE